MVDYIVKINGIIKVKEFEHVDGVTKDLTAEMFLSKDEIIYDIVNNRFSEKDKADFKTRCKDDLILEHMHLGMWIRNSYGLWEVLINSLTVANAEPDSIKHPDNCSFEIMELVLKTLNGEYTPNVSFTEKDFDNAMKVLGD